MESLQRRTKRVSPAFDAAMKSFIPRLAQTALPALLLATPMGAVCAQAAPPQTYADSTQVQAFAEEMGVRGLDTAWVRQALEQAQKLESVRRAFKPLGPGQRKNWQAYRARFLDAARTEAGSRFMQTHAEALERAGNQFGVPVEVIVGILGVETYYGRFTGNYRVVDALATLTFDYPTETGRDRSPYFREQLAEFFVWCARERCQPLEVHGSYAGAMGMPQFMPGNIHRYGTDFDSDGRIDLNNPVDAIGSVARFLAKHGWVRELEPVFEVDVGTALLGPLLAPDILPTFTIDQLAAHEAQPLTALPENERYALVELENGEADSEYVLGSRNFYVLTRYNRSSYYAMAVLQLGAEVVAGAAAVRTGTEQAAKAGAAPECGAC
jgi:membrane-bound lytic murein transglycosylase B